MCFCETFNKTANMNAEILDFLSPDHSCSEQELADHIRHANETYTCSVGEFVRFLLQEGGQELAVRFLRIKGETDAELKKLGNALPHYLKRLEEAKADAEDEPTAEEVKKLRVYVHDEEACKDFIKLLKACKSSRDAANVIKDIYNNFVENDITITSDKFTKCIQSFLTYSKGRSNRNLKEMVGEVVFGKTRKK